MKKKDILKLALMGLALGSTMASCNSGGGPQQDDQSGSGSSSCSGNSGCDGNTSANEPSTQKAQALLKQKREAASNEMC